MEKYIWVLFNPDMNRGRVGYYVTATHLTYREAKELAEDQGSRVVTAIRESAVSLNPVAAVR